MGVVGGIRDGTKGVVPEVNGFFRGVGCVLRKEKGADVVDHSIEDVVFDQCITDGTAGGGGEVFGGLGGNPEGNGDGDFGLVKVGDVVNKGAFVADVNKAEAWRQAECDDDGMSEAIETGVGCGERLIDGVAGGEVVGVVLAARPGNAGLGGDATVDGTNACAFAATELLEGEPGDIFAGEAERIHTADDLDVATNVGDALGLANEEAGAGGEGATVGVVSDAVLADPDCADTGVAHEFHGSVGDAGAGPQEEDGDGGGGDVDDAFVVSNGDGTILATERAVFQVEEGHAVLDLREGLQVRTLDSRELRRHLTGPA